MTRNLWGPLLFPNQWPDQVTNVRAPETLSTGDIQAILRWDGANDLDLHVVEPSGERLYFAHLRTAAGGILEVDANAGCGSQMNHPVENIYWPRGSSPDGSYQVIVNYYLDCEHPVDTPFTVEVIIGGESQMFSDVATSVDQNILITVFDK